MSTLPKSLDSNGEPSHCCTAGAWGYIFQIIFQVSFIETSLQIVPWYIIFIFYD